MIIKYILLILVIHLSPTYNRYLNKKECPRRKYNVFEKLGSKLYTIGDSERRFPETPKKLKRWCKENYRILDSKWMSDFNEKCITNYPRQMIKVFYYSFRKSMESKWCKPGTPQSKSLIKSAPCFNKNRKDIDFCYFKAVSELVGAENAPDDLKAQHYCCAGVRYFFCVIERLTKRSQCNPDNIDIIIEYLNSFQADRQDICRNLFESRSSCKKIGLPPKKRRNQKATSLGQAIVHLFWNFKESPF